MPDSIDTTDSDDLVDDATQAELASDPTDEPEQPLLDAAGRRIAIVGRLGSMNRREARNLLRSFDALIVDASDPRLDWVVIGAEESPLTEGELLPKATFARVGRGEVRIIREAELWQHLGLVDSLRSQQQYYTPAMLAHLLQVPLHVIRRWHRRGLIHPIRTMHKLPYFDFREVATARRLAAWIASGASPKTIEQRLVELVDVLPDIQRPLDQLSILVEGKNLLLRGGEGLIDTGGQLRFDFDAAGQTRNEAGEAEAFDVIFSLDAVRQATAMRGADPVESDDLLAAAFQAEDDDDLETAIDYCHAILARDGARADISFQLAELLYRINQPIAARERYYSAIEQDPDFVEARAGLAAVLTETGQFELAIAAYRGVLSLHEDYAEAHHALANLLSQLGRDDQARGHLESLVRIAPDSQWGRDAAGRIAEMTDRT